jgi:hypothetical protein
MLGLALLLSTTSAAAHNICHPRSWTPDEFFCLRNPSSCDPTEYWQCLSLRCVDYLRRRDRRPLRRLF